MTWAKDFHVGLTFWLRGWIFIWKRRPLLRIAFFPFGLAVAGSIGALVLLVTKFPVGPSLLLDSWLGAGLWKDILYYPLLALMLVLLLGSFVFLFFALQSVICIPFYTLLAGRTLRASGVQVSGEKRAGFWRVLRLAVVKAIVLLAVGCVFFILSFVPGLNLVATLGILFLMAFDCMDYAFEILGLSLGARIRYMWRAVPLWTGMAAGLGLTLFVPGLTLLVIPGAVVGAALTIKKELNEP